MDITELPKLSFEGYYWLSDSTAPILLNGELLDHSIFSKPLPFVVEGHFFNSQERVSFQVRYIEGKYFVQKLELGRIEAKFLSDKVYYGAFSKQAKDTPLRFSITTLWHEVQDELLAGMTMLVPKSHFFTGFQS
ncbi:MAG: TIGR04423 family type III CRISPR-associated protein [Bacteroidota bacterium]